MDEHDRPWRPTLRSVATPARRKSWPLRMIDTLRGGSIRVLGWDALWSTVFVGVTALLLGGQQCGVEYGRIAAGQVADHDIRAQADTEIQDELVTQRKRQEARAMVPDVYVHDTERGNRLAGELNVELLRRGDVGQAEADQLSALIRSRLAGLVVGNKSVLARRAEILLVHVPGGGEERVASYDHLADLEEARADVRRAVLALSGLDPKTLGEMADLVASFVDTNVSFDPEGTAARREAAAAAVLPVQVRVPRGTVLVRAGALITPETAVRLDQMRRQRGATPAGSVSLLGLMLILAMLAFFLWRYTSYHQRGFRKVRHLHAMFVVTLLGMMLLAQGMLWVAQEITDGLTSPFNDVNAYTYLIPVGGGAILIALLANGRIAMVYSAFAAVLFGALTGWDAYRLIWALLVQWAAVYAITTYRERAALLRAGLVAGGAGAVVALALEALRHTLEPWGESLLGAGLAFLGGALGVGLLVSFTLPLLEGVFRVLTDIRLLELSNVNHPLLSQLALKAPGTYNHSLTVGTLAEEAAKAIGANSIFCRVAAFYHDIGKIRKPEYYVENQRGANPHDRLAPSMSALIIAAHVKDGVKLAREAGLPEQIVAIIPQHHGTRLMGYFFEKARKTCDPALGEVSEAEFRYPGPKPQTREAAIFMLCDGIEAAARTLNDPSPSRLREMIHKVGNAIVLDGQFDECDLTFADLEKIEEALLRTLVSMYHHRVDYPGFEFGRPRSEPRSGDIRVVRGP